MSWDIQVTNICKKISYVLSIFNELPSLHENYHHTFICNYVLLENSLVLFVFFPYGPSFKVNLLTCLHSFHNCTVRITCALHKHDHVSDNRHS